MFSNDLFRELDYLIEDTEIREDISTGMFEERMEEKILRDNLPGPFTFIMKVKSKFPKGVCRNERIGIRIPNNKIALKLSAKFPIISTSANKHGEATVKNIKEAKEIFGNEILYLEGEEPLGLQSTIINLDEGEVEVIRKGMGYLKQTEA